MKFHDQHRGGMIGYYLRRVIHISIIVIPLLYYWYPPSFIDYLHLTANELVLISLFIILIFEMIRLWRGWLIWGQRNYEATQISALAWGSLGIAIVLLLAPKIGYQGAAIGIPLIWSLAFGDPVLGEARRLGFSTKQAVSSGLITTLAVWSFCHYWLGTPFWLTFIAAPITVAAEWFKIPGVDDNFTMTIIPLIVTIILLSI